MARYIVKSPIKTGGRIRSIGDEVELEEPIATRLLETHSIEPVSTSASENGGASTGGPSPETRSATADAKTGDATKEPSVASTADQPTKADRKARR